MITGDMKIMEVIQKWPATTQVLLKMSMGCGSCGVSRFETIEEGAIAHGYLPSEIIKQLNAVITEKE